MAGLWGKLGGHGDFLALGLEEGARACVVPWLDGVLAALRDEWGAAWGARFDGMGMLGFWIGPAVSGGAPVAGVMAPSRDRVGRRYPLLVLGRGAPVPPLLAPGGFHAEAAAALAATLAAGRAEAGAWPQDLAEAPPAAAPQGDASLVWARNSGCAGGDLLAEIAHYDHAAACARRSQFWTLSPPGAVLSGDGLPDARGLGWLIEASQAETAPTGPRPADGHGEFLAEAAAPPPAMPAPESASARIEAAAAIPETDPAPNAPRAWPGAAAPASPVLAPDAAVLESGQPVASPAGNLAKEPPSAAWSGADASASSAFALDAAIPEDAQPVASTAEDRAKEPPSSAWSGSDTPASGSLAPDAAMPESGQPPVAAPAGMPPSDAGSDAVAALLGMPDAPAGGGVDIDDGNAGAKVTALPGSAREDARRARLMRLAAAGRNAAATEGAVMAWRDPARPGPASSAAHGRDAGAFVMPDIPEGQGAAGTDAPGMAHGKMDDMAGRVGDEVAHAGAAAPGRDAPAAGDAEAGRPAVNIAMPSATDPPMLRLEPRFRLGAEEQADSRLVLRVEWALPEVAGQPGAPVDAAIWHLPESPPPGPDPLEPDAGKPREGG